MGFLQRGQSSGFSKYVRAMSLAQERRRSLTNPRFLFFCNHDVARGSSSLLLLDPAERTADPGRGSAEVVDAAFVPEGGMWDQECQELEPRQQLVIGAEGGVVVAAVKDPAIVEVLKAAQGDGDAPVIGLPDNRRRAGADRPPTTRRQDECESDRDRCARSKHDGTSVSLPERRG